MPPPRNAPLPALAFGRLVAMASSRAMRFAQDYLNVAGLRLAHWPVLAVLSERDTATQSELAAAMERTPAAVSQILVDMEADGLITRRVNPASKRETLVALSAHGQAIWSRTSGMWRHLDRIAYAGMSEEEAGILRNLLIRAVNNLDRAGPADNAQAAS